MRANLVLVTILVACGGNKAALEQPEAAPVTPLTPAQVVEAGKGAVEQYGQAYQVRSLEALSAVYSQTLDVVVVHQGQARQGWTAVGSYLGELLRLNKEIRLVASDVNVVSLGAEGAAVTARLSREISDGVTNVKEDGMLTLSLRLEGERWVIVTEHFSYRPGGQ
jgi:hypothetical protein